MMNQWLLFFSYNIPPTRKTLLELKESTYYVRFILIWNRFFNSGLQGIRDNGDSFLIPLILWKIPKTEDTKYFPKIKPKKSAYYFRKKGGGGKFYVS